MTPLRPSDKDPVEMKYLKVKQVKSRIGQTVKQRANLDGLGLLKVDMERVLEDTPAVRGMINKVSHLVQVEYDVEAPADDE